MLNAGISDRRDNKLSPHERKEHTNYQSRLGSYKRYKNFNNFNQNDGRIKEVGILKILLSL
jgi:hypothetical protein